jgi:hypothetical protein
MLLHANKSALVAAICGLAAIPNLAAAAVTMQQAATDWKKPAFCKTLDCPHFEVQMRLVVGVALQRKPYGFHHRSHFRLSIVHN